ncbi:MAG: 50S ribosomal protein L20 [Candidatus Shapirobacteria bacterium]
MRTKSGPARRARHKKVLTRTKGFRMTKSRLYRVAREADLHAGQYAFVGRKKRKRDLRRLWIVRLNAAVRKVGLTYSKFIAGLKKAKIEIDRKILSDLAITQPETFKKILKVVKGK